MSEDEAQRALVKERLTAAECEEELCRCKDENQRKQELQEPVLSPRVELLQAAVQTSPGPELNHGLMEEIKEEPEEQRIKEEQEQLPVFVPESSAVFVKTEPKEEETQGEDISAEPHLHSETEGGTDHSSDTDNDEDWKAPLNCSDGDDSAPEASDAVNDGDKSGTAKGSKRKTHQCTVCKKRIKGNKHDLQRHIRTHTGEKPYSCSSCEKTFSHVSSLNAHRRTHTGERPFSCPTCNKTFTTKFNLNAHKRTHTGERPYSCSTCNKTFSQLPALNAHRRTHTGEKPFSCAICEKEFPQPFALTRHLRVHTGEKPFSCSICNKTFTRRYYLNNHSRIHI